MAILDFNPGAVVHVTHLAAAIQVVHDDFAAVHLHMGAVFHGVAVDGERVAGAVVGFIGQHVAGIAASIHRAYAARNQGDPWHVGHGLLVVAAKEGAYVVNAGETVPIIACCLCCYLLF